MRLRLLERQEQLMRMARDVSNKDVDAHEFTRRAESLINQYPELQAITWIDERRHIEATLKSTGWNKSRTAEVLGIERSTLDRKIRRYELKRRT